MSMSWSYIRGWLGFVLAPLALGFLLDSAAADRLELQRAALLLIVLAWRWPGCAPDHVCMRGGYVSCEQLDRDDTLVARTN